MVIFYSYVNVDQMVLKNQFYPILLGCLKHYSAIGISMDLSG